MKLIHLRKQKHRPCTIQLLSNQGCCKATGARSLVFQGVKNCATVVILCCYWRAMCTNLPPTCEMSSQENEHRTLAWFKISGNPAYWFPSMDKTMPFDVTRRLLLTVAAKFLSTSVQIIFDHSAQHWNSIMQMPKAVWNRWQTTKWAEHAVSGSVLSCLCAPTMASIFTRVPWSERNYCGIWGMVIPSSF